MKWQPAVTRTVELYDISSFCQAETHNVRATPSSANLLANQLPGNRQILSQSNNGTAVKQGSARKADKGYQALLQLDQGNHIPEGPARLVISPCCTALRASVMRWCDCCWVPVSCLIVKSSSPRPEPRRIRHNTCSASNPTQPSHFDTTHQMQQSNIQPSAITSSTSMPCILS